MKRKLKIEKIILESYDPFFYSVLDVSEQHKGHQNFKEDVESHFEIIVVSDKFIDIKRIDRHRMVNDSLKDEFLSDLSDEYKEVKEKFENRKEVKDFVSIDDARKNKLNIDWSKEKIIKPNFLGSKVIILDDLSVLLDYIDWTQFFLSWNLYGVYPKIFENKLRQKLYLEYIEQIQMVMILKFMMMIIKTLLQIL